jgi:hypothetical protein
MTNITISDLHPTDFDLLPNPESYMRELSDEELNAKTGGQLELDLVSALVIGGLIGTVISSIGLILDYLFD